MIPPDLRLRADWRRPAYSIPIAVASALVLLAVGRLLLRLTGLLLHATSLFAGSGPLAAVALLYLVLLEIPGRRLVLGSETIHLRSWFRTRTVAWADISEVQPGTAGWMNVNRQLPVAARLAIRGTTETVPIPDVFEVDRRDIYRRVRDRWLAAAMDQARVDTHLAATTPDWETGDR